MRYCPLTEYCFEVVTDDITKMQKLIDYPWDSVCFYNIDDLIFNLFRLFLFSIITNTTFDPAGVILVLL